jgi:hypothetical protein
MPRPPQRWTDQELDADRRQSCSAFVARRQAERARRDERIKADAPGYAKDVRDLLKATNDLRKITGASLKVRRLLIAARFIAIPFISDDDLDTLTGAGLKNWMKQTTDRGAIPADEDFDAAAEVIQQELDTNRTPWLAGKGRKPTPQEVDAFVLATVTLRLNSRLASLRKSEAAKRQEAAVRAALAIASYKETRPPKDLRDPEKEMAERSYASGPRNLASASVDVPIRLPSNHPTGYSFIALEAKDTNSEVNSRKRLIEVMEKATTWNNAGLPFGFRTAAVVSGCLPLNRLKEAQDRGVLLFWEHRLADLTAFLDS